MHKNTAGYATGTLGKNYLKEAWNDYILPGIKIMGVTFLGSALLSCASSGKSVKGGSWYVDKGKDERTLEDIFNYDHDTENPFREDTLKNWHAPEEIMSLEELFGMEPPEYQNHELELKILEARALYIENTLKNLKMRVDRNDITLRILKMRIDIKKRIDRMYEELEADK